jgi:hypothetical protein
MQNFQNPEEGFRSLSALIETQLDEAKKLLELKSELGRLPNSVLKSRLLKRIDDWFDAEPRKSGRGLEPVLSPAKGFCEASPEAVKTPLEVPDDGDIPF